MERYRISANLNNNSLSQARPTSITAPSYISLPPKPHLREPALTPRPRRADDADISIFDAQRYFNDDPQDTTKRPWAAAATTDHSGNPRDSSASSIDGYARNNRISSSSYRATPTASSEASWNSQTGLLTNLPGSLTIKVRATEPNRRGATSSSSGRGFFGRSCPCTGKKSVDVEERYTEPKTPARAKSPETMKLGLEQNIGNQSTQNSPIQEVTKLKIVAGGWSEDAIRGSGRFSPELGRRIISSNSNPRRPFADGVAFSFPVLPAVPAAEEPPRDSLEVFRPPEDTIRKSAEIHRPAGMDRRSFTGRPADEDAGSDASSDLFEIESFSTQMTYRRRDSFDEMLEARRGSGAAAAGMGQFRRGDATPSIAPSECYPPSEVSVEWSVTTAEGFDRGSVTNFSSAASEYDEMRFMGEQHDRCAAAAGGGGRRKSGLLSCVCEKAVSVGPSPVRCGMEEREEVDRVVGRSGGGKSAERSGLGGSQAARVGRVAQKW